MSHLARSSTASRDASLSAGVVVSSDDDGDKEAKEPSSELWEKAQVPYAKLESFFRAHRGERGR